MFDWSRIIGFIALVIQVLNVAMYFVQAYTPEYAVAVAGVIAALQAFTGRVQGTK